MPQILFAEVKKTHSSTSTVGATLESSTRRTSRVGARALPRKALHSIIPADPVPEHRRALHFGVRRWLKKMSKSRSIGSRFAYDGLDRVIHEKARLSLLTSLLTHPKGLAFGELKELCALTDGNLNRHLAVLEEARLIAVSKTAEGSRVKTCCRITSLGRRRYIEYLSVLDQVIADGSAAAHLTGRASTA